MNPGELGELSHPVGICSLCFKMNGKGLEWKMIVILLYTEIPRSRALFMEAVGTFIWVLLSKNLPQNTEMSTTLEKAEKAKRQNRTCSTFGQ